MKIAFNYIKNYLNRSLSIVLSMVIGIALIVGIGTLYKSAKQSDIDQMKYEFGSNHVMYEDVNKKQLNKISSCKNIENIGLKRYYDSNKPGGDNFINLAEVNEDYFKAANTKLIEGRFPTKKNEIILEPWVITNLGLEPKLGEKITIDLVHRNKSETYTLVGIVEDRVREKSIGIKEVLLPLTNSTNEKVDVYVTFDENINIPQSIDEVRKDSNISHGKTKTNTMLVESLSHNIKSDLKIIIICLIISIFSIMVIYSIFNISILQRVSEYGILKAMGASTYQIFKIIISELSILLSISIPFGLILGIVGAKLSGSILGNIFIEGNSSINKIIVSKESILFSIILVVCTIVFISILLSIKMKKISPIDAIRKKVKQKRIKNIIPTSLLIKYISITKIVSIKNIFRNRKCFYTTILSMTLGGTVFIVSNFGANLMKSETELMLKSAGNLNSDYKIVSESFDFSSGMSSQQVKEIENLEGVSSVEFVQSIYLGMNINKNDVKFPHFFDEVNKSVRGKKMFGGIFTKNNEGYMIKGCLYGYQSEDLNDLNSYLKQGNIDIDKMENEDIALLRMPKDGKSNYVFDIKPGDKVKIKIPKDMIITEDTFKLPDNIEYIEKEYIIGGIIDNITTQNDYFAGEDGADIVISSTKFKELSKIENYSIVNVNKEENVNSAKLNEDIYKIISKTPGSIVRDLSKEKKQVNEFIDSKIIFINGITMILLLISLFNIINNISYNLVSRIGEFSIIRAMGVSDKEFKQMIIFEGLIYGILSSILTVTFSLIGQSMIYRGISPLLTNPTWSVNYKIYGFIVFINILIGLIATYLPSKKIQNKSIVESISSLE